MSRTLIHRYIFREIAVPTVMSVAIFTFVLLLGKILKLVELVINKGVPPLDIARLFLFLLPSFLVVTLPLSFLLGVMLAFGRLSADREITACKSNGISLYQLAAPVVALGLVVSLMTGLTTLVLRPASENAFRQQLFKISASRASVALQPNVFNDTFDGLILYANEIDDQTGVMQGVFISDERNENLPSIITAARGRLAPNRDTMSMVLSLENGVIHRRVTNSPRNAYQILQFVDYDINLELGRTGLEEDARKGKKPKEMGLGELKAAIEEKSDRRGKLLTELHSRYALPLAPLLFAMIGIPLGIQPHRSGRGGAFALGLFTFLCYYLLSSFTETLVVDGNAPVSIIWLPNLLFLACGLFIFRRTAEERSLKFFSWLEGNLLPALTRLLPGRKKS
ncbi:MAG: LPS export ABC transporter permease LptF [Syntrophotaleaceae bacterium]